MKKNRKIIFLAVTALLFVFSFCALVGCNKKTDNGTLRFTAPEGTPALALTRLVTDNKTIDKYNVVYEIVSPQNIVSEMKTNNSDLVIMPINAGAMAIKQGAEYKLVSVAVDGSLFMVGKGEGTEIQIQDVVGKKIACIGKNAVPGMVFRYIMAQNGITILENSDSPNAEENEASVQYVADGNAAKTLLANDSVDFAVVGEPAATAIKSSLNLSAEMNFQAKYASITGADNYPQAGLFVKKTLAENNNFMNELFTALKNSKDWVTANATEVTQFAKLNLYESAVFPAPSISRCAINVSRLTEETKREIIDFLNIIANKDEQGNTFDWNTIKETLF